MATPQTNSRSLAGMTLWIVRAVWAGLSLLSLALFVMAARGMLPSEFDLTKPAASDLRSLIGTAYFQLLLVIAIDGAFVLAFAGVGLLIGLRRMGDWFTLAVSGALILYGVTSTTSLSYFLHGTSLWSWLATFLELASTASVPILCYLFPDGRFVPGWTRLLTGFWIVWATAACFVPALNPYNWPPLYLYLFFLFGLATGLGAQIHRYQKISTALQRQQTKWVVTGFALAVLGFAVVTAVYWFLLPPSQSSLVQTLYAMTAFYVSQLVVPVCIAFSVLRYRLWDIDFVINRTIVYTIVVAIVGVLYFFTSQASSALVESAIGRSSVLAPLASAALSAVLFSPLKERTQHLVDRRFYREKVNLQVAFAEFAHEIRRITDERGLLQTIVSHVSELLHLTYGAVYWVDNEGEFTLAVAQDLPAAEMRGWALDAQTLKRLEFGQAVHREEDPAFPLLVPLSLPPVARIAGGAASGLLGVLALGPRRSGAGFSRDDETLLVTLADQVGTAIYVARTLPTQQLPAQPPPGHLA